MFPATPGAMSSRPDTNPKQASSGASRRSGDSAPQRLWLYGRHAVAAALANPDRRVRKVLATRNGADWLAENGVAPDALSKVEIGKPHIIDRALPPGAVHQGVAAEVFDLPRTRLKDICAEPRAGEAVLVLDQITDPQNIGAIFRGAAAFGARAIIVQDRRTPPLAGALAKAAAGAIETLPCVKAVNIARSLEALADLGYFTIGLTGDASATLDDVDRAQPIALALGAEGAGLRALVASTCLERVRIPIAPAMESLNVSTAAAVALYALRRP